MRWAMSSSFTKGPSTRAAFRSAARRPGDGVMNGGSGATSARVPSHRADARPAHRQRLSPLLSNKQHNRTRISRGANRHIEHVARVMNDRCPQREDHRRPSLVAREKSLEFRVGRSASPRLDQSGIGDFEPGGSPREGGRKCFDHSPNTRSPPLLSWKKTSRIGEAKWTLARFTGRSMNHLKANLP